VKLAITSTPSQARFAPILHRGDPAEAFALAAEIGYEGVELHLRRPSDINAAAVKSAARTGLSVPTLGTGMAAGEDGLTFADDNADVRQQAVNRIKEHIALAAELGSAVTIGLIWGRLGRAPVQRASRLAAATDCLRACCQAAAMQGVTVLFEPLNRYESDYPNTVDDALALIDTAGATNLKLLLDTFHMNIEEESLASSVRRAGARVGHVHLVDSNRQAPGHGHTDLKSVVHALARTGYSGYLSFEVLPLPSTSEAARDGYEVARKLLADV